MFTEFTKVKSRTEQHREGKLLPRELNRPRALFRNEFSYIGQKSEQGQLIQRKVIIEQPYTVVYI